MKATLTATVLALGASSAMAADVNPGIIFGSGNANGSWTVSENSNVELGLRAKLRYNSSGAPENTFNWDGVDTYTFDPRNSANPSNRSIFNFEFSINSDVNDATSSGNDLNDFTYLLTVSRLNDDGMGVTVLASFDPINLTYWDTAIGDNSTGDGAGTSAADATAYATLIANNNVAQQSANLGFGYTAQPTRAGTYYMSLTAFDGTTTVTSTDITVNVVPVPTAAFAGLGLLGSLAGIRAIRRR